jgi:hypothetical protein
MCVTEKGCVFKSERVSICERMRHSSRKCEKRDTEIVKSDGQKCEERKIHKLCWIERQKMKEK